MKALRYVIVSMIVVMLGSFSVLSAQQEQTTKQETALQKKQKAYELREKKIREGKAPAQRAIQKRRNKLSREKVQSDSLKK